MKTKYFSTWLVLSCITLLALALRLRAVDMLPIDYDEDDYFLAAQYYAKTFAQGDLGALVNYAYNYEHPPLTKLFYAAILTPLPSTPFIPELSTSAPPASALPQPHFILMRLGSALLSVGQVVAIAFFDPLAGFLLAIHTWHIKYTAQIMLEPLPSLLSALTVLSYIRHQGQTHSVSRWLIFSAVALGLTAAAKYPYCLAGLAVLGDWLWATRPTKHGKIMEWLRPILFWGSLAIVIFFAANPRLWNDPLGRLSASLLYHGSYAQSLHVQQAGFPLWQPFVWLTESVPWHPKVFVVSVDALITLLALLGLRPMWQKQRVFVIWLILALGFLLWWTTKWPQYILILLTPLTILAGEGLRQTVAPLRVWQLSPKATAGEAAPPNQFKQAWLWLLPGTLSLGILTIFPLIYQFAMSLTDFNALSIRDGLTGGVWREVWRGLTWQVAPVDVNWFATNRAVINEVRYVGLNNLAQIFAGGGTNLLFFNIGWALCAVSLQTALGLGTALVLQQRHIRFKRWWNALFILPWAIPEFVGAVIWLRIFEPKFGWLTQALPAGVQVSSNWLRDPLISFVILLIAATWYGFPFMMLATTAALKMIPPETYEAAALDGAGRIAQFRFITWPLLQPLLLPALIVRLIFTFNQFYLFYVMRPPTPTLAMLSFLFFDSSGIRGGGQYAISAAINIFNVVVLIGLMYWFNRQSQASEGVTYV